MEKSFKYSVAGHTFAVCLPEGFTEEKHLSPYIPFKESDDSIEPLFTLKVSMVEDLHDVNPGKVKDCMNDEAPYFWIFDNRSCNSNPLLLSRR